MCCARMREVRIDASERDVKPALQISCLMHQLERPLTTLSRTTARLSSVRFDPLPRAVRFLAGQQPHIGMEITRGLEHCTPRPIAMSGQYRIVHRPSLALLHVPADQVADIFARSLIHAGIPDHPFDE